VIVISSILSGNNKNDKFGLSEQSRLSNGSGKLVIFVKLLFEQFNISNVSGK